MTPIEKFRQKLEQRDCTPATLERYVQVVEAFLDAVKYPDLNTKLDSNDVASYLDKLRRKGYNSNYRRFVFNVLKLFYEANGLPWTLEKKDAPKLGHFERPIFTTAEIQRMIKVADELGLRESAIMRVLGDTGMRREELRNLLRENYEKRSLFIHPAKRGEPRSLKLQGSWQALEEYMKSNGIKNSKQRIFDLDSITLTQTFNAIKKRAKVKCKAGIHGVRRWLVTELYNNGMRESEIIKFMGWKSDAMLRVYLQLKPKQIQEEVAKAHPLWR